VERLAAEYMRVGGERAFQVLQVTEQQIMDAMILANRHGHIACTQGGECLAGLLRARRLGPADAHEHAVLDATAHSLKFAGFQEMYFNGSFPEEYGITPDAGLTNKPELLLDPDRKKRLNETEYIEAAAEAVARRLNLRRKQ
jgi:threonine synthase